jgi:hypothetical protein
MPAGASSLGAGAWYCDFLVDLTLPRESLPRESLPRESLPRESLPR